MNELALVSPFHAPLLPRLEGRRVVFKLEDTVQIPDVQAAIATHRIRLAVFWVQTQKTLAEIDLDPAWHTLPIALQTSGVGNLNNFLSTASVPNALNVRMYLPGETRYEMRAIRILASLGYHCCAVFGQGSTPIDWDALHDLAVYALYPIVSHGDIDPFTYAVRTYEATAPANIRTPFFRNPAQYILVDESGALYAPGLHFGERTPLELSVEQWDSVPQAGEFNQAVNEWKTFFVNRTACAECEAWRVCMGTFSQVAGEGCRLVFQEVLDGAEKLAASKLREWKTWQP